MPRNPQHRQMIGVVVGVKTDDEGNVYARIAVYPDRLSERAIAELPASWPAAAGYRPTVGARLAVNLVPSDA